MNYLIIFMLALRVFICEKASPAAGIFFDICFCFCFAVYIIFDRKILVNRKIIFYPLAFSCALLLNTVFSVNSYNSQNEVLKFLIYMFVFVFVYWQSQEKRRMLIISIFLVSLIISLRAIYQYFSGMAYINQHYTYDQIVSQGFYAIEMLKQKRVVSWFFAPNLLAAYLLIIAPVVCGYIIKNYRNQQIKKSVFFSIIFICLCLGLYLTRSFGAYLGFIIAMLFMAGNLLKAKEINKQKWVIAGVLFLIFFGALASQRAKYFLDLNNPQNSFLQRLYYWKSASAIIQENPIVGIGLGNFGIVYPRFKQVEANETIYAHNLFFQLWTEIGTIMFFSFLVFFICFFTRLFKRLKDPFEIGLFAGSIAFLIQNFFDFSFFIIQSGYVLFIIIACMLKPNQNVISEKINKSSILNFFGKSSYVLICGLMIFFLTCEYKSRILLDSAYAALQQGKNDTAIAQANLALDYRGNNDMIYYFLAVCHKQKTKGKFSPRVINYYRKAISLNSEYAYYYYYLADYYFDYKFYAEAKKNYLLAIKFYPENKNFKDKYLKAINAFN